MTDDIISKLRRALTAGPTPGRRFQGRSPHSYCVYDKKCWYEADGSRHGETPNLVVTISPEDAQADAQFFAAASPDNIAALLDRLDAAEKELTTLWEAIGLASTIKSDMEIDTSDPLGMMQQVARHADELERENERLRDLLARTLGGHRDLDLQDAIIAALDAARGEK